MTLSTRAREIIWRVLVFLFLLNFTIMFVKNGYRKFDPEGFWSGAFERWGYPGWFMVFIGVLEFGGGLLILLPRVSGYAALVLAAVMLGALVTRLIHGISFGDAQAITFYMACMSAVALSHFSPKLSTPLHFWAVNRSMDS